MGQGFEPQWGSSSPQDLQGCLVGPKPHTRRRHPGTHDWLPLSGDRLFCDCVTTSQAVTWAGAARR